MAFEGGGKIKSKRGHSSSKPYERRKSLFSRITDSIKEVLRPSWLAADDSQTVSARDRPPATSVSEEEEEFVSPVQSPSQLPGHIRCNLNPGEGGGSTVHHGDTPQAAGGSSSLQWLQRPQVSSSTWDNRSRAAKPTWGNSTSTFDKSQISRGFFSQRPTGNRPAETETAVKTNSRGLGGVDPDFDPSPSTASGRDRLGLPYSRSEQTKEGGADMLASASTSSSVSEAPSEERPSKRLRLWSPQNLKKRQSQQSPALQPAFKISVFSSPRLNESAHESSFYSGRTAYGGASSYRRTSLSSSLPYQNALPIRKSVTAKPLNNSGNAILSSSASQILKTLERLSDTKRSRINETDTESLLSFTPTSYRKPSRPLQTKLPSRSLEIPVRGPPTQHRQSPVVASIAKNRQIVSLPSQRPPAATATLSAAQRMEEEEERDISFQEDDKDEEQAEPTVSRSSGKMKHQKSYDTRGRSRKQSREGDDVAEMPNLRTDFTLPISAMPAINLGGFPSLTKTPLTSTNAFAGSRVESAGSSLSKATSMAASVPASVVASVQSPPKLQFTFSSPIHKSAPGPVQPPSSASPVADFRFSSPLKVSDSVSSGSGPPSATTGFSFTPSAQTTVSQWGSTEAKPKSLTTGNSTSSPVGGFGTLPSPSVKFGSSTASPSLPSASPSGSSFKVTSELKSGSVMDILGKGPFGSSPSAARELKQGSVMDVLGGKNDMKLGAPSAAGGFNPAAQLKQGSVMDILGKSTSAGSLSGSDSLMAQFAPAAGSWECGVCMVRNGLEINKCLACQSPKPGQQSKEPPFSKDSGSSDSLFARFAPPAGSWECESCMVRNKPVDSKCAACQTPRPGAASSSGKSSSSGGDSLFAKFAPPSGSWECESCMVRNKLDDSKCVACQTPRPGAASSSSGKPPGGDSLFAKFAPPAGSWECGACMVRNKPDCSKCVACDTPKPGASSTSGKSSSSGRDSLFAKFAPPAGSWECGACMLQNKAEVTKCVACDTPRSGASSSSFSSSAPDSLMSKFKRPAGSWECDVCLVQNTETHTKCVACQSPRPGAMSTGTVPPSAPVAQLAPGGGLTFKVPSSTSASSPFLAACATSAQSSNAGFKFVPATSTSSSSSGFGGVQLGSSSSEQPASASSTAGGFTFGQQNSSNSASSTLPSAGFSFGAKDSSAVSLSTPGSAATSATISGFQFGMPSASGSAAGGSVGGFVFGSTTTTNSITNPSSSTESVTASGFALGSAATKGGFQFGNVSKAPSEPVEAKREASKLTTSESVSRTESFSPVFGGGKPSNSFALCMGPSMVGGSVSSLTTGGFQFQGSATNSQDSTASLFATSLSSSSVPANDSSKTASVGAGGKSSTLPKDFSFGSADKLSSDAASKPGLFASTNTNSAKKNGVSSTLPSSSTSQGFVFGAASSAGSLPTNLFSSVPQLGGSGFPVPAKMPVNGEVGAPPPYSFGQSSAPSAGGFAFGGPAGNKAGSSSTLASAKPFSFGTDAAAVGKPATEKRHLENDVGPTNAKKRGSLTGSSSTSEGFKFGNPAPDAGNDLFKFPQTSQGGQEKGGSLSTFGGQASGFGASTQGGGFFAQQSSNAASSTSVQQAASVFGAGAGTGQFSFGITAGSQSNAAAASPFGSEAPAPTQGFSFGGATPSFNFGANNANTSAPMFQFGSSTGEPAPAQPAAGGGGGGVFVFGQPPPTADTTSTFPPAPNPAGFGAAPAQSSFSIGTGDGPRKIKRAVRRTVRK
ncbi:hypothetical protein ACOMHN_002343 [Nucella lapillus]